MGYLDLAKKIEVGLSDGGRYPCSIQPMNHRLNIRKGNSSIRVTDYSGAEPAEIPFTEFCHRTMRDVLGGNSDMLVEFDAISGPILAATGDNTLRLAQSLNPDRAVLFHEIINFLLPHWDSSMMEKRLIEILPSPTFQRSLGDIIEATKRILNAEVVS